MPTYPEIRLSLTKFKVISKMIDQINPDAIHIATEGPLGFHARHYCILKNLPFTTCYHTRFPEYVSARVPIPTFMTYSLLRWFHNSSTATLVSTDTLKDELKSKGFTKLRTWRRGINYELFSKGRNLDLNVKKPIFLYVGRISPEKNLEEFLSLDLPGTKIIVGAGPAEDYLTKKFSDSLFLGLKTGQELADIYASADVFVFPSRSDTYGLVMLEALAAGTPVAAFPVTGPREVLAESGCGALNENLRTAALSALEIPREACKTFASRFTMQESALHFFSLMALRNGAKNRTL